MERTSGKAAGTIYKTEKKKTVNQVEKTQIKKSKGLLVTKK
jgi:hypothetical protein